jgi:hypothetical protein
MTSNAHYIVHIGNALLLALQAKRSQVKGGSAGHL